MNRSAWAGFLMALTVVGLAAQVVGAPFASAAGRVDREGVYNMGGWFQYGLVEGESRYGLDFTNGPGYSFHLRYTMSRHTALALYFDNQTWNAVSDSLAHLKATTVHAGLRYFSLPSGDVMRYAELTVGFFRPEVEFPKAESDASEGSICFPGEGLLVHAGVGAEIFFTQAWALEFGLHGYGLSGRGLCRGERPQGEKNWAVSGQAVVGIDYFLLR